MTSTADWIIDLRPEAWPGLDPGASDNGGQIVAAGTPELIAATEGELGPTVVEAGAVAAAKRKKRVEAASAVALHKRAHGEPDEGAPRALRVVAELTRASDQPPL